MIPLMHSFILAASLFTIGLLGAMIRRNFFFLLLSLMVMFNGAVIALVAADTYWQQPNDQILSIIAISLALLIKLFYRRKTVNIDLLSEMKG